jgi:hypothetical protein
MRKRPERIVNHKVNSRDGKLHVTSAPGAGITLPLGSAKPGDAGHRRTG